MLLALSLLACVDPVGVARSAPPVVPVVAPWTELALPEGTVTHCDDRGMSMHVAGSDPAAVRDAWAEALVAGGWSRTHDGSSLTMGLVRFERDGTRLALSTVSRGAAVTATATLEGP